MYVSEKVWFNTVVTVAPIAAMSIMMSLVARRELIQRADALCVFIENTAFSQMNMYSLLDRARDTGPFPLSVVLPPEHGVDMLPLYQRIKLAMEIMMIQPSWVVREHQTQLSEALEASSTPVRFDSDMRSGFFKESWTSSLLDCYQHFYYQFVILLLYPERAVQYFKESTILYTWVLRIIIYLFQFYVWGVIVPIPLFVLSITMSILRIGYTVTCIMELLLRPLIDIAYSILWNSCCGCMYVFLCCNCYCCRLCCCRPSPSRTRTPTPDALPSTTTDVAPTPSAYTKPTPLSTTDQPSVTATSASASAVADETDIEASIETTRDDITSQLNCDTSIPSNQSAFEPTNMSNPSNPMVELYQDIMSALEHNTPMDPSKAEVLEQM